MANGYLCIGGPLAGQYRVEQGVHFTVHCEPCNLSDALSGRTTIQSVTYLKHPFGIDGTVETFVWLPVGMTIVRAVELLLETYGQYEDLKH